MIRVPLRGDGRSGQSDMRAPVTGTPNL